MLNRKWTYGSRKGSARTLTFLKAIALAGAIILGTFAPMDAHAGPILFDISYSGVGWDASSMGALQYAANIWGGLLSSNYAGETINIDAIFDITLPAGALAGGQPVRAEFEPSLKDTMPMAEYFFFPEATANHLTLGDLHPGESEIQIKYSPTASWYYGVDGNPGAAQYDFVTISLHEIAHGLGLTSGLSDTMLYPFTIPSGPCAGCGTGWYYDTYVFNNNPNNPKPAENPLGYIFPVSVTSDQRLALVTDPFHLAFGGAFAFEANADTFPILYSPPAFIEGSSVSHLSEATYPLDLMVPHATLGGSNHAPSALDLAMLKDVGWIPPAIPEPGSLLLLGTGTGILFLAAYRRRRK